MQISFLSPSYLPGDAVLPVVLSIGLCVVAWIDVRSYIIPDQLLLATFLAGVAVSAALTFFTPTVGAQSGLLLAHAAQTLFILLAMWLFWHFNADGFGYGDLKLLITLGAFVPLPGWIVLLLVSCVFALLSYAAARLSIRIKGFSDSVPPLPLVFGPCVTAAWFVLAVPQIIRVFG